MVDRDDLNQVSQLYTELKVMEDAIANIDNGGRIFSLSILAGETQGPPVVVPATHIEYPPQMMEAIKAALESRRNAIEAELSGFGVTGVEARR